MNLTKRQRAFLDRMLDLYREHLEPVHYTSIAEKLGVSRTTAYDMMRLLERKGYLTSDYVVSEEGGPGRSTVVFSPTFKAHTVFKRLAGPLGDGESWARIKSRILAKLNQGEIGEKELLEDFLGRIPDTDSALSVCAETLAAMLVNIRRQLDNRVNEQALLQILLNNEDIRESSSLSLLPGISLGVGFTSRDEWQQLMSRSQEYLDNLQRLDREARSNLMSFLKEMVAVFQAEGRTSPS